MSFSDLTPENDLSNPANNSAFGDYLSDSLEPVSQISATYGITDGIETFNATGGSVSNSDNMFVMSTGTNVGGYGVVRTDRSTVYREGQGLMARFTAIFDGNAVANSLQFAGLFSLTDTIAFGYDGANFGIIYESYGAPEIRTLTVTVAGNGTLSLTLNSVLYSIPITTGTIAHNCYEIQAWMRANQSVWNAQQVGSTVVFQAKDTSVKAGTYSVTGAGLTGSIAQNKAGVAKTSANVQRASWDNNPSWFNPTLSNVYMIKASYLGFGPLHFFIMNTSTCRFELVHTIKPLGNATKPSISKRALKVGWACASLGSTTNLTVKGASAATFIEGESRVFGQGRSYSNTDVSVDAVFEPIITIRCSEVFFNKVNLGRIVPIELSIATDATKPVEYTVVKNASLGEANFFYYNSSTSIAQIDTSSITTYSASDGLFGGVLSAGGSQNRNLKEYDVELFLNETLTVFARKTSGTNPSVTARIIWKEDV